MDSLILTPVSVRPERSEAESKDVLTPPAPVFQGFRKGLQAPRISLTSANSAGVSAQSAALALSRT